MSSLPLRHRSSTSTSTPPPNTKARQVLNSLLEKLHSTIEVRFEEGYPDANILAETLRLISRHISAFPTPSPVQDDFRQLHGFSTLLAILRAFSGYYNPIKRSEPDMLDFFALLDATLQCLDHGLRDHSGSKRYFRHRVEAGGWEALEQAIASVGLGGSDTSHWAQSRLFGKLLGFSFRDPQLDKLCQAYDHPFRPSSPDAVRTADDGAFDADAPPNPPPSSGKDISISDLQAMSAESRKLVGHAAMLHNPEILRAVISFWQSIPRLDTQLPHPCSVILLEVLSASVSASIFNLAAVHSSRVFSQLLQAAFEPGSGFSIVERNLLLKLCKMLMYFGVSRLEDAQFLLRCQSPEASEFCREMVTQYYGPPFFHFDLSHHGHSSIELPTLGRAFPPQSSQGYTFTAWIRVDRFDPTAHTTLFGVFDKTQTCFLLVYLERDTRNFILQTSVTSQKPSVRFKSLAFSEKRWYHIALVHRRPRTISASKASLYVNGEFVEQLRCGYPSPPPASNGSTESFASFASANLRLNPVQAFIGTPRDLSTQIGPGLVFSKWSLASAHLFEDVLSDDFIAVHFRLGPRYQGNFQDSLGGFQTYEASAALGLRNELFHPGKDQSSDIIKAIREKASSLLPESRIALSILPTGAMHDDCISQESQLFRALPRAAANSLVNLMRRHGSTVVLNAAVVSLTDALLGPQGVAVLSGQPVVSVPSHLDDNFWQLAGFTPLALKLLQRASTPDETLRWVEVILECVQNNWRNSEAMERDGGYSVLGMLLRIKLGQYTPGGMENGITRLQITDDEREKLSSRLLSLILGFVGYNHAQPIESFIINPLAYRILLIDFDIWRKSNSTTQKLYYQQFVTFAVMSKYHEFNSRRLMRMRIIKRLLDAMKAETISEDVLQHFLKAFECLIKCSFNGDVHRALALFLTYVFHPPPPSLPRTPKPTSISRSSTPGLGILRKPASDATASDAGDPVPYITKKQLGKHILGMFSNLLCEKGSVVNIKRFARTVTNKWLLYLLSEDDAEIVVYGAKILARLLVSHGSGYASKFSGKTGGFVIMADRLKRWWDIPTLWPICFSILFGYDVAEINFDRNFDFFSLIDIFGKSKIVYPDVLPVIGAMIQRGIKEVVRQQAHPASPHLANEPTASEPQEKEGLSGKNRRARARSMDLRDALDVMAAPQNDAERHASRGVVLQTVIRFLTDLHNTSPGFKDFALTSDYVRLLLSGLYPAIVSTDAVTPETELNSQGSVLNFEGGDVIIRPVGDTAAAPVVRTARMTAFEERPSPLGSKRGTPLRKASSFVLLNSEAPPTPALGPSPTRLAPVISPRRKKFVLSHQTHNAVLEGVLELVINILLDQVLQRRDFVSFGLFLKIPPGFQEHQAYFESYILRNTISHLGNTIQLNLKMICEPKILTNMARFTSHITDAAFEGWFMGGEDSLMEFTGMLLEYLQREEIAKLKTVRLCSQAVTIIRRCFLKVILLKLSAIDDPQTSDKEADEYMHKILIWQPALLGCLTGDDDQMRLIWYQLYAKLVDDRESIRLAAASILRIMMVQKPDEASTLLGQFMTPDQQSLTKDFERLTEVDNESFVAWVDQHRPSLDALFFGGMSRSWEDWVIVENQKSTESVKTRLAKRKDRLKAWHDENLRNENTILRHDMGNGSWMKSIFNTEHIKHQRLMQDQQDDMAYTASTFAKMERELTRPGGVFSEGVSNLKWRLDPTEGRNRMRLRLLPDYSGQHDEYQPKRRANDQMSSTALRRHSASSHVLTQRQRAKSSASSTKARSNSSVGPDAGDSAIPSESGSVGDSPEPLVSPEDDFELIEDPNDPADGDDAFEDRNRKVMRRLQQGDKVQAVYNISRIIGLEACDGILILGKDALYIMDNVFQCASGEIVNAWQAPPEERDPFSQIISGKSLDSKQNSGSRTEQESRSWRWQDVISVSKRRFLFRDVAIEVFFTDGRSYLLTTINPNTRDDLFVRLFNRAPHINKANALPNPEDAWRLDTLRVVDESPQGFGSKFGSLFSNSSLNPMTRKWQKGEISNFHYLMMVNTMAGRTFNDLTQYPVFPWVLADYTSEELDLDDPRSFRDLSKPMGMQTPARIPGFDENYRTLLEIGDTPYHYGTHYSSAMIVASYLIRLPPFVQSYILVQGGTFDHADRLFHSIPGAWKSASCNNKTDVRELTPEFFCFPEFLKNINGYNFGTKESTGERVDDVALPPWAKGDPRLFIAKNREALECPYVSQNLHHWIDLIFGYKQQGDAAVDNMNVFHPLSYRGAKNLDTIEDPQERAIAVQTIHNFGQTPHQVFAKSHPAREVFRGTGKRLDVSASTLTRSTYPLIECHERVSSLVYAPKVDRLLCTAPFRLNFAPYDKYMEWGYADRSVRFFFTENRRPAGLFENLHGAQISCAMFADSRTLVLAGEDCVISVYTVVTSPGRPVELLPRSALHGHKTPVTTLAASKSFSTLVSVSRGQTFVWDLNRLGLIRKLPFYRPVECARVNDVSGEIMLCSGPNMVLFGLNGSLILDQRVCSGADDYVHSCAFYEGGSGSEWLEEFLVFTGHKRGRVNVWRRTHRGGRWALELLRTLEHGSGAGGGEEADEAAITCIATMPTCVYTGDEDGKVYEWSLTQQRDR